MSPICLSYRFNNMQSACHISFLDSSVSLFSLLKCINTISDPMSLSSCTPENAKAMWTFPYRPTMLLLYLIGSLSSSNTYFMFRFSQPPQK